VILAGGISSRMKKPSDAGDGIDTRLIEDADNKAKSMIGVGDNYRPFLDYLLFNSRESGYQEIVIVIGEKDYSIKSYYGKEESNNDFYGLNISYVVQKIPTGRVKPLGTADALYQGLKAKEDWKGERFTVCNSDNLYSQIALKLMLEYKYPNALIDYDRDALEFEHKRIEKFAVTVKDDKSFLIDIIEKPSLEEIEAAKGKNGIIGVSMNIFSLNYDQILPFLEKVPLHPIRQEKELPEAVKMMAQKYLKSVFAYPLSEHVPDLTNKSDIMPVKKYLNSHFSQPLFKK
jgi:glucose-1-phosphate thymidylyltransferase